MMEVLAELLLSYEMDAPHWNEPAATGLYPYTPWSQIAEWLTTKHCGDCVGLPSTCPRCVAEDIVHKARWIAERLELAKIIRREDQEQ